ncbi:MAG: class I SAM-dependent methyltransferase [Thermosynechococcaceae cyanobacterium MS004]|nr:class I SAM-dependent methyltransferase [Thermosynechococcaceae cyanobacterium MS004]
MASTSKEFMEPICQLCACKSYHKVFTKKGYEHLQCDRCRSIYVFPRPSEAELIGFYQQDGEHLSDTCWQDSHRHAWDLWKQTLKMAKRKSGTGKLLDIGCGTGEFMRFAQQEGWTDVQGIEVVPEIAAIATQKTGATVYATDFWNAPLKAGDYSVIAIWDVIEHLRDVSVTLSRIYDLLKPGGVLIIGTVNRDGFSIKMLRHHAQTFGPPEHLTFFTQRGAYLALATQNFSKIHQWSVFIYLQEWTRFLPKREKTSSIQAKDTHSELTETKPTETQPTETKLTETPLFLSCMKLANVFLRLTNLGDELVIVAQK